jgi:hypothetical protein
VYGGVPPVALKLCEYATPGVPPGSVVEVVIVGGAVASTSSSTHPLTTFPSLSATWTLKRKVPSAVGVPDSTPALESANPPGASLPVMVHVYGGVTHNENALRAWEYVVPTTAAGSGEGRNETKHPCAAAGGVINVKPNASAPNVAPKVRMDPRLLA